MGKRKTEWLRIGKGIECRNHPTRKHGIKFDRYLRGRYKISKQETTISFGWESEWVAAERSRMEKEGETGQRKSFLDHCMGDLARYKENKRKGVEPTNPDEDREAAKRKEQKAERAKAEEEKRNLLFGDVFTDRYVPFMKAEKKKSWSQELSLYNTWISSTLGNKRMNDITYEDVERIRDTILKDRSERTAQYVIAIIRRAFNVAINRDHFFGSNPTKKVKIPYPDNAKVRFFTKAQANDFLTRLRAKSPQLGQMAMVSLFSGLRWGEVAALTWIDVDLEHGTIFVAHPKNTFARTVPMPQRLIKMFSGKDRPTGYGLIFPSKSGDKSLWVSKTVKRVIDDMKLNEGVTDRRQHITYHTTRHSFCSWLAMEGKPLHTIGKLAGHRTSKMTERYSHLLPDTLAAAVSVLDKPDYDQSPKSEKKDVAHNVEKKNNVLEFKQLKAASGKT